MRITDLPTPSLVLDRAKLVRNIQRMAEAARRHGVALRPHLKTSKSIDVARLALEGQAGGIAVSTLKEAEYFVRHGIADVHYAVSIVPDKLERVAAIQNRGARVTVITDSVEVARAIDAKGQELDHTFHVLIEIDCGEGRSGVYADSPEMLKIAELIDRSPKAALAGVMSHAGHSYGCRSLAEIEEVAEAERAAAVTAAERIRMLEIACPTVSVGSTPTALHARGLEGVTEMRPGVYMFGDMFQAQIGSCAVSDLAVSVITEVISHRAPLGRLLIDAGALALSKDRSTQDTPNDIGFGLVAGLDGRPLAPQLHVGKVYQEHGQIVLTEDTPADSLPVGARLRVYPNHICMTGAMYGEYYVVDSEHGDGEEIVAVWPRTNGW
ncbi:alanine racemase [Pelagibius sp. CAU 1746]|uniref:alanine racemase n=1 Tax=Pelagibius sp. CAU 1746 TaxID=3140370 RepID=UPI00325BDB83